jgi:tRNA (pseudouridine54-N1)-methyltransferase
MTKHFIYFSSSAATSGKSLSKYSEGGLMKAGRMDIAIHSFIQGIFLSHDFRKDVIFHFLFYGMPDPPKHLQIRVTDELQVSKKDVGKLIQKMLYKYREGQKHEVFPECFIEKKSFLNIVEELYEEGNEIFILEKKGEDLRKAEISEDCVFILGDHEGLPKAEIKRLKKSGIVKEVSIGDKMYFASQTVAVVNNELDYRGI